MNQLIYEADGKYYLSTGEAGTGTEISKYQFDQITAAITVAERPSGGLSQAELIRLHGEQDPSSPLYKRSQSTDRRNPEQPVEVPEPITGYYEPSKHIIDAEAAKLPESTGTTTFTTEAVTKSLAGLPPEGYDPEASHNELEG